MQLVIRPEGAEDRQPIRQLNREAFADTAEADLVDALRDGGHVEISLVAENEGQLVGHILLSRVTIHADAGSMPALALAPMAVLPAHQRRGIGSKLVVAGLDACRELGHEVVLVLGHPEFYSRFDFSADLARSLSSPFGAGEAWMAIELRPGALQNIAGQVEYSPPFTNL